MLFGQEILKLLLVLAIIIIAIVLLWCIYDKHDKKATEKHKQKRLKNPIVAEELNRLKLEVLCYQWWFSGCDPLCWVEYRNTRFDECAYLAMKFNKCFSDDCKYQINKYEKFLKYDKDSKKRHLEDSFYGTDYKWIENRISMYIEKTDYDALSDPTVYFSFFINLKSKYDRDIVIDSLNQYLRDTRNLHNYRDEFKHLQSLVFPNNQTKANGGQVGSTPVNTTKTNSKNTTASIKPKSQPAAFDTPTQAFLRREADGKIFNLSSSTVTIGKSNCSISGGYDSIHARLTFRNGKWYISNMLPENQTYTYNDKKGVILKRKRNKDMEIAPYKYSYTLLNNRDNIILQSGHCKTTYTFLLS